MCGSAILPQSLQLLHAACTRHADSGQGSCINSNNLKHKIQVTNVLSQATV